MEDKTKVMHYMRKNKRDNAVIYVRGHDEEIEKMQEMMCRLYCKDEDYEVLFVTKNLEDVKDCDVLVVTNASRISRNQLKYYEILKEFKKKGIKVELATQHKNAFENFDLVRSLLK